MTTCRMAFICDSQPMHVEWHLEEILKIPHLHVSAGEF